MILKRPTISRLRLKICEIDGFELVLIQVLMNIINWRVKYILFLIVLVIGNRFVFYRLQNVPHEIVQ